MIYVWLTLPFFFHEATLLKLIVLVKNSQWRPKFFRKFSARNLLEQSESFTFVYYFWFLVEYLRSYGHFKNRGFYPKKWVFGQVYTCVTKKIFFYEKIVSCFNRKWYRWQKLTISGCTKKSIFWLYRYIPVQKPHFKGKNTGF